MAIFYAFCCLGFAAVNDFVFKLFARKERSRGVFVFAVGVFYTLLVSFLPDWWGPSPLATLAWGVLCGIFSVVGNIFLIESMSRLSAGMCSTVYRLNLLLVVPLAMLFFHESLQFYQWIGIIAALLAVVAFMPVGEKIVVGRKIDYVMLILAMTMRAGLGLANKAALGHHASANGLQIVIGWCWIVGGLLYYLSKEYRPMPPARAFDRKTFGYGALSGLFVAGIIFFMVASLKEGDASIVLPIQQMSFLATFFLGVVFLKEKVTPRKIAALVCGVVALLLLSCSKPKAAPAAAASVPAQPTTNEVQK